MKKQLIIVGIIVVIVLVAVLFIVIPDVQKNFTLSSLKYFDYENGWGFNPPDNWQIDDTYYLFLSPSVEDNMSDKVLLGISMDTTSSDINEIGQKQLEEFNKDFWSNKTANFSLISHGKKLINNMDSYEVVYSFEPIYENNTIGEELKIKTIVVLKGNKALHIVYQSLSIYYDKYESDIDQSLSSLIIV